MALGVDTHTYTHARTRTHTHTHTHTVLWLNESDFKKPGVLWPARAWFKNLCLFRNNHPPFLLLHNEKYTI